MIKTLTSFFLFLLPLAAIASSVDSWLDKMNQAMSQLNYQGTLIVRQADNLQAIKVKQGTVDGDSWQTLESQTGEKQIIFRENKHVTTIFPSKKLITISAVVNGVNKGPLHPALSENREKLKELYLFKLGAQDRIANKTTQIVHMIPRDKHRYGYTFWLDQHSGLLLKCDLINQKGRILEQLMYSDIELLSTAPENQLNKFNQSNFKKILLSNDTDIELKDWSVDKVPVGFMLTRSVKTNEQDQIFHMVYSDGMASVSVFVELSKSKKKSIVGRSNMGPVNVYSSVVGDAYITAIGDVPASTVRMMAQSVQIND